MQSVNQHRQLLHSTASYNNENNTNKEKFSKVSVQQDINEGFNSMIMEYHISNLHIVKLMHS